jgi:hypothetical protein
MEIEFEIEISQKDLDKLDYIVNKLTRVPGNMIEVIDRIGEKIALYQKQSADYANGIEQIMLKASGRELSSEEQQKIHEYE